MEYRDYYQILGVARTATAEDIKKSYRRLARRFHPDVSKESNAEARFKEMQEAYEVLRDPEKRAAYDQLGSEWQSGQSFRPPPDFGRGFEFSGGPRRARGAAGEAGSGEPGSFDPGEFSDFFSTLFGGGAPFAESGGAGRGRARRDHHARIDIELEEAFHGGSRMLELKRPELTAEGRIELREHRLRVNIPAGVAEGQLIRLAGQGAPAQGREPAGDLFLEVHLRPHRDYEVQGRDVTRTVAVAPWEAALGATVPVSTLAGTVQMQVPPGAQSGQKLRLRGRGLPGDPPGDQYVQLKVILPPADSPESRALYEQMRQELAFDPRAVPGA